MRDHGGNLDMAMARFGGSASDWIDLSTGINPQAYPLADIPAAAWEKLPTGADMTALEEAARSAYGSTAEVVSLAGAQAAIQLIPRLRPSGRARVLSPTYSEHAAVLKQAGWRVEDRGTVEALAGADIAVVVNPNNPDGWRSTPEELLELAGTVGLLVVDESFADPEPKLSLAGALKPQTRNIVVLRSFGKFYGLAGLRLGFALTGRDLAARLRETSGPWPVSGPAIAIGRKAFADRKWQGETVVRLERDIGRLDGLAGKAGWSLVGGTALFRTYDTGNAPQTQDRLARAFIWSRIFSYSERWVRLGLPSGARQWARVEEALES